MTVSIHDRHLALSGSLDHYRLTDKVTKVFVAGHNYGPCIPFSRDQLQARLLREQSRELALAPLWSKDSERVDDR
jgi:hypothetical protein